MPAVQRRAVSGGDRLASAGDDKGVKDRRRATDEDHRNVLSINASGKRKATAGEPWREAEGKGFAPPLFFNSWRDNEFQTNWRPSQELRRSVSSGMIPSDPVFGGNRQGENRVKFSRRPFTISLLWGFTLLMIGITVVGGEASGGDDENRRRTREERGLPSNKALQSLARTYLETQQRLWPELVGQELPAINKKNIDELGKQFTQAFLKGEIIAFCAASRHPRWKAIAAAYLRYSCDNSNPRSLDQQLRLSLERAKQNDHFIPWMYVFADAAVSGTTAARTGYSLVKDALCSDSLCISAMYIDEIGRASRDMVESLSLGRLMEQQEKRLVGVSDGFDTINPMWKTMLSVFAALQEWFVDQLRAKVKRGMDDAFDRGDNTHAPGIGYKLVPTLDAYGQPVIKANGRQKKSAVIDGDTNHYVLLAFRLYAERMRSPEHIARYFNRRAVGGRATWDGTRIRSLLNRYIFVGIRVRGRFRHSVDPVTGKITSTQRPKKEWKARRFRRLQIVPWSLWKKAQKRLRDCRNAYSNDSKQRTRTDVYPTTLVRPRCGVCGKPLWLGRGGKYASFCCLNGRDGKNGCSFKGYKSVSILENAILSHLESELLTDDRLEALVIRANEFLTAEAAKPKRDVKPIKAEIRKIKSKMERLADAIEDGNPDVPSLVRRLEEHGENIKRLNAQLRDAKVKNDVPPVLDADVVKNHLCDLRDLLRKDVAQAAPIIRQLTGPIVVHQVKTKGAKKATWIAKFEANLIPVVTELARARNCPSTDTLEYLCARDWTIPIEAECVIEKRRRFQQMRADILKLKAEGDSDCTIAAKLKIAPLTVADATCQRPYEYPNKKRRKTRTDVRKRVLYRDISVEVARRKDELGQSFGKIAADMRHCVRTIQRAYDYAHPEIMEAAIRCGGPPRRAINSRLGKEKKDRIAEMIRSGARTCNIVLEVGCGRQTVARMRKAIN